MSILTELWRHDSQAEAEGEVLTTVYLDFEIQHIKGVFRVTNSDGVDREKAIKRILKNIEFFQYFVETGKVFEEAESHWNWGNGWEWKEKTHTKLEKDYRIDSASSWHTCPFGGRNPLIKDMNSLHAISSDGVKLLYSWDRNRQPVAVCYFFPYK